MKAENINSTIDYDMFLEITSNRDVDRKHLKKLVESIEERNLLHLFPICVNGKMEVLDGQHRLAAAKRLKIPIFYVVDDGVTKKDISVMNKIKKNWTPMDYINYYTIEKFSQFMDLSRLVNKYSDFGITTILELCSETGKRRMDEIKEGTWGMENEREALFILDICMSLSDRYEFYSDRSLVKAIRICVRNSEFNYDRFLEKLALQPRSFVKCVDITQYVEMIEELYNYHNSSKGRVRFT